MIGRLSIPCVEDHEWDPVDQCIVQVAPVLPHPVDLLSAQWVDQVEAQKCPLVVLQVQWEQCRFIRLHFLDSIIPPLRQSQLCL